MFEKLEISMGLYNIYMKIFMGGETDSITKDANFIGCVSQYVIDICLGGDKLGRSFFGKSSSQLYNILNIIY